MKEGRRRMREGVEGKGNRRKVKWREWKEKEKLETSLYS